MVLSRKIVENTIAMGIYKLSVPLFSFLLLIFIAKTANVELLGKYSLVTTFFIILHVLPLLGLSPLVIRELASRPQERDRFISNLGFIAIIAALIFNLILAAIIYFLKYPPEVNKALFYVGLSVFPGALAFICESAFVASEKMKYVAGIAFAENFLRALFSIIILSFGFGLKELFLVIMVLKFVVFGFYFYLLNRVLGKFCFNVSKKMIGVLLKHSRIFFPAAILGILFARVDFLFLSRLSTFENLGFYAAAYRIVESVALLSTSFIIALSPVLARSYKESVPQLLSLSREGVKYIIIFSLPVMFLIFGFSSQLIQLLYKDTYFPSVLVLRILSFSVLFFILDQFFSLLLVSTHHQKDDLKVMSFGAVLYVSLLYIFISKWSIAGAATATLLTMIFQCAARYFLISRKVGTIRVLELALRPVLAVLCIVVVFMHLSKSLNFIVVSCALALLYIFMIFVLKAVSLRKLIFTVIFSLVLLSHRSSFAKDIDVFFSANEEYTDNVYNSDINKKSDFITTLSAKAYAKVERLNYMFNLDGGVDYQQSTSANSVTNLNKTADLYFKYNMTKMSSFVLTDTFADVKQVTTVEQIGTVTGMNRYLNNIVSPTLNWGIGSKLLAVAGYTHELFDSKEPNLIDNRRNEFAGTAKYYLERFGDQEDHLFAGYSFMKRDYTGLGDAKVHTISAGINKLFMDKRLKITPSFISQTGENIDETSFSGIGYMLDTTYRIDQGTSFGFMIQNSNDINSFVNNVYKQDIYGISLMRQLNKLTALKFAMLLGNVDYREIGVKNRLQRYSLDVSHALRKDLNITLLYFYEDVDSGITANTYAKNSINIRAAYKF